jgi:hypothetical protein
MRAKLGWGLVWGAIIMGCFTGHSRKAAAGNCALYARAVTGVDLYGAAGGWWYEAAGRYQRGQMPAVGSILVFRPTGIIPSGHVAVVAKVVGPSMVLVDQSNWYHGRVTFGTPVVDTSPNHDWTRVAVMNPDSGQFGRDSPTFGFVYPQTALAQSAATLDTRGFDPSIAVARTAYDPTQPTEMFHFAVAEDYRFRNGRGRRFAHRRGGNHAAGFASAAHTHGYRGWRTHPAAAARPAPVAAHHARNGESGRDHRTAPG